MRDQRSGAPPAGRRGDEVQFVVLALLLDPDWSGGWSLAELAREVGCEITAAEAVVRLHAAGLVHRVGELVFAARPAVRFCQLLRE
ncbi:MAG TPA: hypothetical protein VK272_13790 [Solirubrobacteraceae bacterium]|nr:hypothetical protein [Solirubrobacteraceae bacterium]